MKDKGFTLIEILVAVVIIGILASIAIPTFQKYRIYAYHASTVSDVRNLLLFEQSFYSDYSEYAPISPTDKDTNGLISKNITLQDGSSALFRISGLSNEIDLVVNIDGTRQYANIAGFHSGGNKIAAVETDFSRFKSLSFSGTLTNNDIPAATSAEDLSSWKTWK